MATKKKSKGGVDTQWFRDRLRERDMSVRQLGRDMGWDAATASNALQGKRKIRPDEVAKLAGCLRVSPTKVMVALGVPADPYIMIPVVGVVRGDGSVNIDTAKPIDHAEVPDDTPPDSAALVGQTAGGSATLACFDGALFVVGPMGSPDHCVGRLAVAGGRIGHLRQGLKRGSYRVSPMAGGESEDAKIDKAAPVLWIRP